MTRPFRIEAVLFDFDGTLTRPGGIDFEGLREALGAPPGIFALEFVLGLPRGERARAEEILERFELQGADRSEPNDGAEEEVLRLREIGLPVGIVTRNTRRTVERAFSKFPRLGSSDFDLIITRDDDVPPKPEPDSILLAAERLGVGVERVAFVGDFVVDVEAGRRAGAVTVHLIGDYTEPDHEPDFRIERLSDLKEVVVLGLPLPNGKLPNRLLGEYLEDLGSDPSVLVGAGVGEDVAALDVSSDDVIVAHSDPITLTTGGLGRYAVQVNANDIATSGGTPKWFLSTVLMPAGSTPSEVLAVLGEVADECSDAGVVLVGGHTEVTDAVARPVVSGTMLGTVDRGDLRRKDQIAEGDAVILTRRIALEGTALLAVELEERLLSLGMTPQELAGCRDLLREIGILEAARVAMRFPDVSAMHDITEGGIATAMRELSAAGGREVTVFVEQIPVLAETARICGLLGADPLGLIASGSLLICCRAPSSEALVATLAGSDVEATAVGLIGSAGRGVRALRSGVPEEWPSFDVDEAARLLSGQAVL